MPIEPAEMLIGRNCLAGAPGSAVLVRMPIATFAPSKGAHLAAVPAAPRSDIDCRDALGQLAGGVCLLTVGASPDQVGFTVKSVGVLPGEPARVIVPLERAAVAQPMLRRHRSFGVSVLALHHGDLAARFSGSACPVAKTRFAGECWHTMRTGSALLCDALAAVDCELEELIDRHAFALLVGRVVAARARSAGGALVFWRGAYHGLPGRHEDSATQWEPILKSRNVGCG